MKLDVLLEKVLWRGVGERVGEVKPSVHAGVCGCFDFKPGFPGFSVGDDRLENGGGSSTSTNTTIVVAAEEDIEQRGHGNAKAVLLNTDTVPIVEAWVPERATKVDLPIVCNLHN